MLLGIGLRFYGLDERGTTVSDAIYYTNIAESWAAGEPIYRIHNRPEFYRPVAYSLFGWGLRVFGSSDASIKSVNAILDSLNILALFSICWLATRDAVASVCVAVSYALLPMALLMSRIEFVHVSSASMILLSLWFFMLRLRCAGIWRRRALAWLCGVATGLAALTHEELLVLTIPYLLLLLSSKLPAPAVGVRRRLELAVIDGSIYAVGAVIVCRSYFAHFIGHGVRLGSASARRGLTVPSGHLRRVVRFIGDSTVINASAWVLYLWLGLTLLALVAVVSYKLRGRGGGRSLSIPALVPAILIVVHMVIISRLFDQYFARVFFPLISLVLLSVILGLVILVPEKIRSPVIVAVTLSIVWANVGSFDTSRWWSTRLSFRNGHVPPQLPVDYGVRRGIGKLQSTVYRKVWSRQVFDLLEGRVDQNARLLVAPAVMYSNLARRVFQLDYYFGDDAVYVVDHDSDLQSLVKEKSIRFVLFSTFDMDPRLTRKRQHEIYVYEGRWKTESSFVAGALYGFPRKGYSIGNEWKELHRFLAERDAKVFGGSLELSLEEVEARLSGPSFFVVFELPQPTTSSTTSS